MKVFRFPFLGIWKIQKGQGLAMTLITSYWYSVYSRMHLSYTGVEYCVVYLSYGIPEPPKKINEQLHTFFVLYRFHSGVGGLEINHVPYLRAIQSSEV